MKFLPGFISGMVFGFLVAISPGCGRSTVSSPCSVDTCQGCCDATLGCLTGNENTACGVGAVACQKCSSGQSCSQGVCRLAANPVVDAGTKCGPSNCSGCCDAAGVCVGGTGTTACGKGGAACATCTGGQTCEAGACKGTQSCTGCSDALGNCFAGNTVEACGVSGTVCSACLAGQNCVNGVCSGGGCNSANCSDGCCSGDVCVRGQPNGNQCGLNGNACVGCQSGEACLPEGKCGFPQSTDGGIIPPTCGPGSLDECVDGCCQSIGGVLSQCIRAQSRLTCGLGGTACKVCDVLGLQTCQNGVCQ